MQEKTDYLENIFSAVDITNCMNVAPLLFTAAGVFSANVAVTSSANDAYIREVLN